MSDWPTGCIMNFIILGLIFFWFSVSILAGAPEPVALPLGAVLGIASFVAGTIYIVNRPGKVDFYIMAPGDSIWGELRECRVSHEMTLDQGGYWLVYIDPAVPEDWLEEDGDEGTSVAGFLVNSRKPGLDLRKLGDSAITIDIIEVIREGEDNEDEDNRAIERNYKPEDIRVLTTVFAARLPEFLPMEGVES